jgi:hypothetical protein
MDIVYGTKSLLINTGKEHIVTLDIGFAQGSNKSCGIAHWKNDAIESWNSTYGDALTFLCTWPQEELHLIVEAPLFYVFDENGNPVSRTFEDVGYYWYAGAGVAVAFAVLNLFKELSESKPSYNLFVYEGYLPSFGVKQAHALNAASLCSAARDEQTIFQYNRSEIKGVVRSIHYYLGLGEQENLPPVVQPL